MSPHSKGSEETYQYFAKLEGRSATNSRYEFRYTNSLWVGRRSLVMFYCRSIDMLNKCETDFSSSGHWYVAESKIMPAEVAEEGEVGQWLTALAQRNYRRLWERLHSVLNRSTIKRTGFVTLFIETTPLFFPFILNCPLSPLRSTPLLFHPNGFHR
jgi:hypothetical protein